MHLTCAMVLAITLAASDLGELDREVARILPTRDEDRWLEIPWHTDLLAARREAGQTGRPLFMWLMDGDPLGCT